MANMNHNPEKDILKLAKAVIRYCEMPPQGKGKWTTDLQYLAEYVAPLAGRMKERYKNPWRRIPAPTKKETTP